MSPNSLSVLWADGARELCNHLWQSTAFAGLVALLALALRKYQARTRYWLWIAASAKFLIPFSMLIVLGSHLVRPSHPTELQASVYFAVDEVSQPFAETAELDAPMVPAPAQSIPPHSSMALLPALLGGGWLCGFAVVLASWYVQWRKVATVMREAEPLLEGREVETLRRMEQVAKVKRPMEVLSSHSSMEPGVFGFVRPVLLWPEGISRHLGDAHLEAVLAHEVCHLQRRDNLTSVVHMIVEALFWFHPLVWWMEKKLVEERERACDEEVLHFCNQPHVYAASILKVCEFSVESPLPCISGITGSDLKKRIGNILADRVPRRLDFSRKLLLLAAATLAIAVPIVSGQVTAMDNRSTSTPVQTSLLGPAPQTMVAAAPSGVSRAAATQSLPIPSPASPAAAPLSTTAEQYASVMGRRSPTTQLAAAEQPAAQTPMLPEWEKAAGGKLEFETASIQLIAPHAPVPPSFPLSNDDAFTSNGGDFTAAFSLLIYIQFAYKLPPLTRDQQQTLLSQLPTWATTDRFEIQARATGNPTKDQIRLMMQSLLADRFKLAVHIETQERPVYALTLIKPGQLGPKLRPHSEGPPCDTSTPFLVQLRSPEATDVFPKTCNAYGLTMKPDHMMVNGARDTTMALIAADMPLLGMGSVDRAVVDETGVSGRFDFTIEWSHDAPKPAFVDLLQEQLGLKLEPAMGKVETLVIDHVEKPLLD